MPLVLLPFTEADGPRAAVVTKAAYAPNPFDKVLFPGPFPEPEPGRAHPIAEQLVKELREDPTARFFKVVDTDIEPTEDNQQMIGFGQWYVRDQGQPPPEPRKFPPGANAEACEALFGGLHKLRVKHLTGKKHVHLKGLQVVPEHQRRGAGRMLVMWGVEEAKRLGLPAYLEASEEGHRLYLSCGFRNIDMQSVDCKKWGRDAAIINHVMVLEPAP